jgi:hypothetical protein
MDRGLMRGIVIAVLVFAAAAAIGIGAYNAGVSQGLAESGRLAAAPPGIVPYVYAWPHHWGFGFFPILFLVLFLFVLRGLLWVGPWRRGWGGGWGCGYGAVPPAFDEWHRRAHERQSSPQNPSPTA